MCACCDVSILVDLPQAEGTLKTKKNLLIVIFV